MQALPYPGYSWVTGGLPGQHEVRHFPSLGVPFTFAEATWQNQHWTFWELQWLLRWLLVWGQAHSQLELLQCSFVAGREAAEKAGSFPSPACKSKH